VGWKSQQNLRLQYKETTTREFLDYLRPKLKFFVMHNYVSKFQEEQYNVRLDTFSPASILLAMDFTNNYSFQDYNLKSKKCIGILFK